MQIKGLHKNIYRLYGYARTQECLDAYREIYQGKVSQWEKLAIEGVTYQTAQAILGFSRATYYRMKRSLKNLEIGIIPPSKKPKKVNKRRWGEAHLQLVLRIRRENPTYGKEKIAVILKRDHAQTLSESTVGRILSQLKERGLILKSSSTLRTRRKRHFRGHAKPWYFKDYKTMVVGERIQIDHMTVTKNSMGFKHFQGWDRKSKYIPDFCQILI